MDPQVRNLLDEEAKVNRAVKAALERKKNRLAELKDHTDREVMQERTLLEQKLRAKIDMVSQTTWHWH